MAREHRVQADDATEELETRNERLVGWGGEPKFVVWVVDDRVTPESRPEEIVKLFV